MKCFLELTEEAKSDIQNAAEWYEEKREGLGIEFTDTVLSYAKYISKNPHSHPKTRREYRELVIRRFPYVIIYRILKQMGKVVIVGVVHSKRDPAHRKRRK